MSDLRLLAIFVHPDDETFRPSVPMAELAQQGVRVEIERNLPRHMRAVNNSDDVCRPRTLNNFLLGVDKVLRTRTRTFARAARDSAISALCRRPKKSTDWRSNSHCQF